MSLKTPAREKEVIMMLFSFKNTYKGPFGVFAWEKEVFMSIKPQFWFFTKYCQIFSSFFCYYRIVDGVFKSFDIVTILK